MSNKTYIFLNGMPAPVDVTGCPEIVDMFPEILPYWPYETTSEISDTPSFFIIRPNKAKPGYVVDSPYFDKPKTYPDEVNTLCALVAELAWEQLRNDPSLLCVHAAAVEIKGRLLLIPNKRRAGKSTLTAALAANGYRVFTDDFLPLAVNDDGQLCGVSCGIAPRLRLPLPDGFGDDNAAFVQAHSGPSNPQYKYLELSNRNLASQGDMLPIGGIMVLNRDSENKLEMTSPEKGDVLRALITQNFAREMKSGGILRSLEFLVSNADCYELSYAEVGETLDLIKKTFATWQNPIARFDALENTQDFQVADLNHKKPSNVISFEAHQPLQQSPGVTIRDMGTQRFLSDQNGQAIHQLNETSAAIWQLLDEPTSLEELTEIFQQAFPDNDADAMCKDILKTLKKMSRAGLVQLSQGKNHGK